jgi:DNA-binding CsgD family transcriptional regulator
MRLAGAPSGHARYGEHVGPAGRERQRLLDEARTAHREHRYDAAYSALRSADAAAPLALEDLQLCADAAWWLGLIHECLRQTEHLHRRYLESGDVDRAAVQALDLGGMLAMRGEYALASGWLSRARRLLAGRPVGYAHGLLAYTDLSQAFAEGRLEEARRIAEQLHRMGDRLGEETLTALGLLGRGLADVRAGDLAAGLRLLDESMLPVVAGAVPPDWAGHIYCTITSTCLDIADLVRAREWVDAADRWLEGFPDAVMFDGVCRAHRVYLFSLEGDWLAAEAEAEKVAADLRELNIEAVAEAEYLRAEVHRLCGRYDDAAAGYARAGGLGRDPQPGEALLELARGDREGSWTAIADAVSRASGDTFRCVRLLRAQVEIGLATGHTTSAAAAARRLREVAGRFGTSGFSAWADHAEGQLHLVAGDNEVAATALARAAEGYRSLRSWYDLAVAEAGLAVAHHRQGAADLARVHQDAATAGFRRLNVPPPDSIAPASPAHPGGLTAREVEVLAQVARGASNQEVALALSVSAATVRRHLANIYLKLGVGSRTAAAHWAHDHGLVPQART